MGVSISFGLSLSLSFGVCLGMGVLYNASSCMCEFSLLKGSLVLPSPCSLLWVKTVGLTT